ncbi:MAG: sugar phosphate isomerase/epimerase [Oscillospiraceae bacterium]|jgi:D-psicose/D-tagatose/L-ribulose 3-epimerase|nr:sugar phosphate isomerase/epimerase [Oscillospiraceae bacterium]
MFRYGVHKATWGQLFDLDNPGLFFRQAAQTGAEVVELRPPDYVIMGDKRKIDELRVMARDSGIELIFCFGYPTGLDMRSDDPFIRKYAVEHMKRSIEGIAALGEGGGELSGVLYSCWPTLYDGNAITRQMKYEHTQRCIEGIRHVMPTAEALGVQINLEVLNRFENYIINTAREGLDFAKAVDSKSCGLLLDTFHMAIEEDDIPAAIRSAGGYLGKLHATEPNRKIPFHNNRIHWPCVGDALRDIGFSGSVVIEAVVAFEDAGSHNMRMWRDQLEDVTAEGRIEALKAGIAFLRASFQEH